MHAVLAMRAQNQTVKPVPKKQEKHFDMDKDMPQTLVMMSRNGKATSNYWKSLRIVNNDFSDVIIPEPKPIKTEVDQGDVELENIFPGMDKKLQAE